MDARDEVAKRTESALRLVERSVEMVLGALGI
jgi:hypothetical protein